MTKEEKLEKDRQYRIVNREKIKEYKRKYRAANREKELEKGRAYYAANKSKKVTYGDYSVILAWLYVFSIPTRATTFRIHAGGRKYYFNPEKEVYKIADFLKGEIYCEGGTFPISEKTVEDYKKNIRKRLL